LEIGPRFQVLLANFLLCMLRKVHKPTSGQIFNLKFEIPIGYSLFKCKF